MHLNCGGDDSERLLSLGFVELQLLPCTFLVRDPKTRRVVGLLCVHVEDLLICGDDNSIFGQMLGKL